MSSFPTKLIIISYRSGTKNDVLAEYLDDKVRISCSSGIKTYLVTALGTSCVDSKNLKVYRTPSVSWKDFKLERELNLLFNKNSVWIILYSIIPATVGRIFDFLYTKVNKDFGHARWSWTINAVIISAMLKLKYSIKHVFGIGSASAYLSALLISKFCRCKLYIEIPDPIIGSEMPRDRLKLKIINLFEMSLIKSSAKYILTTEKNYDQTKNKYPQFSNNLIMNYPFAWDFGISKIPKKESTVREILHLGTLYGSRNLDLIFTAIDELLLQNRIKEDSYKIVNLGNLNCKNRINYLSRKDFELLTPLDREIALERASRSDVLLLIQHSDSRSDETIPYKLFDYSNLDLPILALTRNQEINKLLLQSNKNYVADLDDKTRIRNLLEKAINDEIKISENKKENRNSLAIDQFKSIFS